MWPGGERWTEPGWDLRACPPAQRPGSCPAAFPAWLVVSQCHLHRPVPNETCASRSLGHACPHRGGEAKEDSDTMSSQCPLHPAAGPPRVPQNQSTGLARAPGARLTRE